MRTTQLALLLATLAVPAVPLAQEDAEETTPTRGRPTYDVLVRALTGPFYGAGVREEGGTALILETDVVPKLRTGDWTLEAPLRLDHRETFGAKLRETVAGAGFEASWRATRRLRIGPLAQITYVYRPGWEELYLRPGEPETTDRYTYLTWKVGADLWQSFGNGRHLRAEVAWVSYTYKQSPAFLETDPTPSHLVPADNGQLRMDLSYKMKGDAWSATFRADGYVRHDEILLAKNATTGGLTSTNPLQELAGLTPSMKFTVRPGRTELWASYGLTLQSDRYQGYYSYTAHELALGIERPIGDRSVLNLRAGGRWQLGGPDSRGGVDSNGNLRTEDGERLYYRGVELGGEYAWLFRKELALVAEARVARRVTNYPDYVAGSYPSPTSTYDIKWDYTNWRVLVGFEWRPEFGKKDSRTEAPKAVQPATAPAAQPAAAPAGVPATAQPASGKASKKPAPKK